MAQIDQSEIYDLVLSSTIQQYTSTVICTLLVYDTLITMSREIKYFWIRRWYNAITILFFLIRYIGILSIVAIIVNNELDISLNHLSVWIGNIGGIFVTIAMDYILAVRALVLWDNNRVLSILLKMLILCETIIKLVSCIESNIIVNIVVLYGNTTMCIAGSKSDKATIDVGLADWSIQTVISFIIFSLALYKAIKDWKLIKYKKTDLIHILIRDQIYYYIMIIFCSMIGLVDFRTLGSGNDFPNVVLASIGDPVIFSLLGSRMAINLKEAGESKTKGEITNHWELNPRNTLSEPQFAAPSVLSSDNPLRQDPIVSQASVITIGQGKQTVELQLGVAASQSAV